MGTKILYFGYIKRNDVAKCVIRLNKITFGRYNVSSKHLTQLISVTFFYMTPPDLNCFFAHFLPSGAIRTQEDQDKT